MFFWHKPCPLSAITTYLECFQYLVSVIWREFRRNCSCMSTYLQRSVKQWYCIFYHSHYESCTKQTSISWLQYWSKRPRPVQSSIHFLCQKPWTLQPPLTTLIWQFLPGGSAVETSLVESRKIERSDTQLSCISHWFHYWLILMCSHLF